MPSIMNPAPVPGAAAQPAYYPRLLRVDRLAVGLVLTAAEDDRRCARQLLPDLETACLVVYELLRPELRDETRASC